MTDICFIEVALDSPLHRYFDYRLVKSENVQPRIGQLVWVSFGRREELGIIHAIKETTDVDLSKIKDAKIVFDDWLVLDEYWLKFCEFASFYYQKSFGEVALATLPKALTKNKSLSISRALKALDKKSSKKEMTVSEKPSLNQYQQDAFESIVNAKGFAPIVLLGVTGSGKTEVYLNAIEHQLRTHEAGQILILVPEINLTPQVEHMVRRRFPNESIAILHSGLSEKERLVHWISIMQGNARIVLGTRMSIWAPFKQLLMIIVDEEQDASYKQQDGVRYSARDLAVWRAKQYQIPVILASATPSLETWNHVQRHEYQCIELPVRAVQTAALPNVHLIDTKRFPLLNGLTQPLIDAIKSRLEKKEQTLLFLNRRGYAPALSCEACGWVSHCHRCSSYLVYHKTRAKLVCHHCGFETKAIDYCPSCHSQAIHPIGRGTQRLEEELKYRFPSARIVRVDADSTRKKKEMELLLETIRSGKADIIVGTQILAKGHNFDAMTLVGVINPDAALFSGDFRASERLFALLVQVAGRAGRTVTGSEVFIQTRYVAHPLYQAVLSQKFESYAHILLEERMTAKLPPFAYLILITAEAKKVDKAIEFLHQVVRCIPKNPAVFVNEPIPMNMMRLSNRERAQLVIESNSRQALHQVVRQAQKEIKKIKTTVRYQIEIDPLMI